MAGHAPTQSAFPSRVARLRLPGRLPGVGLMTAGIATTQLAMAVAGIVAARALGPEGKGVITAVTSWATMLVFVSMAGMAYAASVRVAERPSAPGIAVANSLVHSLVVGGAVALIAALTLPSAFANLGDEAVRVAPWMLGAIPLGLLTECLLAILLALARPRAFLAARLGGAAVLLALTGGLAATDRLTVESAVLCFVAGWATSAAASLALVPLSGVHFDRAAFKSDLRFGLKVHAGWVLSLAALRLDLLVMSLVVSTSQVGYYGVANNLLMPVFTVTSSVALLLTPAIARRPYGSARVVLGDTARRYLLLCCGIAGLVALASPLLVPLLFGEAFEPAVHLIWILAPGFAALGYADMVVAAAVGLRQARVANVVHLVGVAVTVVLLPVLLPPYAATGAAVTSTIAYGAAAAVAWRLARRLSPPLAAPEGAAEVPDGLRLAPGMAEL